MQCSDHTRAAAALAAVLEQIDAGDIDATPIQRAHIAGARQALIDIDRSSAHDATTAT